MQLKAPSLFRRTIVRNYILGGFAALTLVVVAACGGGQGAPGIGYPAAPNVSNATFNTSAPATLTLPAASGLAVGSATVSGAGSVTVAQSVTNPSAVPVLALKKRATTGVGESGVPNTPVAYITVTATSTTSLTQVKLAIAPTATIPAGSYYVAFWNGSQWVTVGKPASVSGNLIAVSTGSITPPLALASGSSLYLALYTGQIFVTPTPPPPAPVASPSSQTLNLGIAGTIDVTTGQSITITAVSSNTAAATVTQSVTTTASSTTATFTVTPVGVGSSTITFTDPLGHTGTASVTVVNTNPSPVPAPETATIGLGDVVTLSVPAKPGTPITAVSTNTAALTVSPASANGDNTGHATFTVTGVAAGNATVNFQDNVADQGAFTAVVSGITNGTFSTSAGAGSMTGWTTCSYAHTPITAVVNESTPSPVTPVPTQSPGSATAATTALTGLSVAVTPPPNDNPSPPAGVTSPAPSVLGANVALVGTINAGLVASPKGEFGICQKIVVPSTPASLYLSFWEWEGSTEYTMKYGDQDAVVLDSTGTTVQSTLFVENHCYADANIGQAPGQLATSGCWPHAYGGDSSLFLDWTGGGFWTQRGPYNLSAYAGQTVTLYVGNWSFFANNATKYANFLYVGNVQLVPTSTFPTVTPLAKTKRYMVTISHLTSH